MIRLDVDRGWRVPSVGRVAWLLARAGYRVTLWSQTRSPSGAGWHIELEVDPAPGPMTTVALQAVLGSDPFREACNVARATMVETGAVSAWWVQRWNVLYRA